MLNNSPLVMEKKGNNGGLLCIEDDRVLEVAEKCASSFKHFCRVFFPEHFTRPFAPIHEPIFEALEDDSVQKLLLFATRNFGKSTLLNFAYPAWNILFRRKRYIVPISAAMPLAMGHSETLKNELLGNDEVIAMFGPVRSNQFSKEQWVTQTGTCVMPKGLHGAVRGIKFGRYRPDLIVLDDVEDSESVESEDQRDKVRKWFYSDIMKAVDWQESWRVSAARGKNPWKIVVVGTMLHEDSLLANLAEDKTWLPLHLELCDKDLNSLWPEFMTTEALMEDMNNYREQGLLSLWYREVMNIMVAPEAAAFKEEYFQAYDEHDPGMKRELRGLENIVLIDPAKVKGEKACDTAIVGAGVDMMTNKIFVRDIVADKMHPDEMYDTAFEMARRLGARTLGVEVTSLNEFITYPLRTEMYKRGLNFEIIELKPRGGEKKTDRIRGLIPLYRQRHVWHNRAVCHKLEQQLLAFPKSKLEDVMDAFSYIIPMLEEGGRYFTYQDEDEEEDPKAIEKEYEELEADEYGDYEDLEQAWYTA